jgi:hypothetical protein
VGRRHRYFGEIRVFSQNAANEKPSAMEKIGSIDAQSEGTKATKRQ